VRRRAITERVEQEPETRARVLVADAEHLEDLGLQLAPVDPDAPRPELPAVQHQVVRERPHREQVFALPVPKDLHVVGMRHRERVMRRDRSTVVVESFEQREVDDPEEVQTAFVHGRTAELESQRAEHVVDEPRGSRRDEHQIASSRAEGVDDAELLRFVEELRDRGVDGAVFLDPRPDEPGRAQLLRAIDKLVELGA
jgi:hypothetical protein